MTVTPEKTVCVFCGSHFGNNEIYGNVAKRLGELIAEKKWGLVYGGGSTGVMGAVATGCASSGGYVHGIIPEALIARERTDEEEVKDKLQGEHDGSTPLPDSEKYGKTTLVKDMHTRKRMMGEEANAFIALPGGYGTFEELFEVITWFQLNIHKKPIVIVNVNGFFDNFLKFIDDSVAAGFISKANREILNVANTEEETLTIIDNFKLSDGIQYNLNWSST